MEMWLKRCLSLFFDFEHYGNLIWLAIPLFICIIVTIKKRKRWELALAFVLALSCFLMFSKKGESNYRYFFTLYPFILGAILLFGWEFIKNRRHYLQIGVLVICGIAVFVNFYHFRKIYEYFWKYKVTLETLYWPDEKIEYINKAKDLKPDDVVLVCSKRNLFFYYSNKKGLSHRDPKLRIFRRQKNKEAALDILKNQLKVRYIFRYWNFRPTGFLNDIITNDCDLIIKDDSGYLYKIRENTDKEVVNKKTHENI